MLRLNFYIQKMGAEGKMRKRFVLGFAFGATALTTTALSALDDAMELRLKGPAKRR
jgi:hypothetical protein